MKARGKQKCGKASMPSCFVFQLRAKKKQSPGRRIRKYYESDSPGKLFTYVSAGNIETPSVHDERESVVSRGITPIVAAALFLLLIWLIF